MQSAHFDTIRRISASPWNLDDNELFFWLPHDDLTNLGKPITE